jgi:hypothetical protein
MMYGIGSKSLSEALGVTTQIVIPMVENESKLDFSMQSAFFQD